MRACRFQTAKDMLSKLSILNTRQWKLNCLPLPRGMSTHRNELTECQTRTYDAQFTTKKQDRCRPVELGGHSPSTMHIDVATWGYPSEMLGQFTSKRQNQFRSAVPEGNSPYIAELRKYKSLVQSVRYASSYTSVYMRTKKYMDLIGT